MSNTCISKSIKVKLLDLSELHRQIKASLKTMELKLEISLNFQMAIMKMISMPWHGKASNL
ncbi:hypothetical protein KNT59_gp101 [Klebsiella phage KPV15]|uniref:Uncharacterized protein n=1 Tax=Klebsiella phage KPV15 TaxID=1913572 RepID=A0A1J0MHF0_9CAUD|nr:hypothetical protein KNT59_gp101 [Klebsiella phage KPV15]APD20457.1 hypothetical protein [Klebsiella phage KPV15]